MDVMDEQPEPGTRLYSAHLDRWVRYGCATDDAHAAVIPDPYVGAAVVVPASGLFPTDHYPAQIGTRDAEGYRTHTTPGEVCAGCSDVEAGRWVPVSECPAAWAVFEAHHDAHGYGAWLWLT